MKKITGLIFLTALIFTSSVEGRAYGPGSPFVRFDGRDSMNRRVEGVHPGFQETTFSRFYAMFSPPGVARWRSPEVNDLGLVSNSKLSLPYITPSMAMSERELLPRLNARHLGSIPVFPGIAFLLTVAAFLTYKPRLQTEKEPRFLIPVLLE